MFVYIYSKKTRQFIWTESLIPFSTMSIHLSFKKIFSRTNLVNLSKQNTKHPCVKEDRKVMPFSGRRQLPIVNFSVKLIWQISTKLYTKPHTWEPNLKHPLQNFGTNFSQTNKTQYKVWVEFYHMVLIDEIGINEIDGFQRMTMTLSTYNAHLASG